MSLEDFTHSLGNIEWETGIGWDKAELLTGFLQTFSTVLKNTLHFE